MNVENTHSGDGVSCGEGVSADSSFRNSEISCRFFRICSNSERAVGLTDQHCRINSTMGAGYSGEISGRRPFWETPKMTCCSDIPANRIFPLANSLQNININQIKIKIIHFPPIKFHSNFDFLFLTSFVKERTLHYLRYDNK